MIAHVCPKCRGEKEVIVACRFVKCKTCEATGVVWETTLADVTDEGRHQANLKAMGA